MEEKKACLGTKEFSRKNGICSRCSDREKCRKIWEKKSK
jgi:hypothetical protein